MRDSAASTSPPGFLVVGENVARNPVARAVARQRVQQAVRDFLLRMYLLPDGTVVESDAQAAAKVLVVAIAVKEAAGLASSPETRVMAGGMGALVGLAGRHWRWKAADAVALDSALQRALAVFVSASAAELQRAHRRVA